MIKVCHITTEHKAFDDRIFYKECVSLAKDNFDVYLLQEGKSCINSGVKIIGIGDRPVKKIKRILFFNKSVCLAALKLDCDIYHIHDAELLLNYKLFKNKGKKVVFDSHEFNVLQARQRFKKFKLLSIIYSLLYKIFEDYVLKQIDAVISVCKLNGKEYFENKCKNVVTVRNYTILDEFYNKFKTKINNKNNIVCYVGGITEQRGIKQDVIACNKLNSKFCLAGWMTNDFKKEILSIDEKQIIDYKGMLDRIGVFKLLDISKVGLCTLLDVGQYLRLDAFGIKVYEYLAMGIPVILSHNSFNDMMVEKYKFGLTVNPYDTNEIANAIKYIFDNKETAEIMSDNARKFIKENNWEGEKIKLINLYNKMIGDKL